MDMNNVNIEYIWEENLSTARVTVVIFDYCL